MTPEEAKRLADKAEARSTASTVPKQLTPWKPGQSGNPSGRAKGSRNKFGEAFVADIYAAWQKRGAGVIERVIDERPQDFLKVCASLLPKELKITDERELTDDELVARLRQLDAVIRPFLGAEGAGEAGLGVEAPARH